MEVMTEVTEELSMYDLFYLAVGCAFLVACWFFTKACEKL
jgi:hypothetical protein